MRRRAVKTALWHKERINEILAQALAQSHLKHVAQQNLHLNLHLNHNIPHHVHHQHQELDLDTYAQLRPLLQRFMEASRHDEQKASSVEPGHKAEEGETNAEITSYAPSVEWCQSIV